jgi:hypothetical protein
MTEKIEKFIKYRQQEEEFYIRHLDTIGRNLFKNAFGLTLGTENSNSPIGNTIGKKSKEHLATAFFSFNTQEQDGRMLQNDIPVDLEVSGIIVDRMMGAATITFRWNFQEEDRGRSFNHLAVDALVRTGEVVVRTGEEVIFRSHPSFSAYGENPFLKAVRRVVLAPLRGVEPITESD